MEKKDWTEAEFEKWRDGWMREKGCPFFSCSQALFRHVCGESYMCGVLFSYKDYKEKNWTKVCDIKLDEDKTGKLPSKICPACTGSMGLKVDHDTGRLICSSWCRLINNLYEEMGYIVDRKLEKYMTSWGTFLIPVIGEENYLQMLSKPEEFEKFVKQSRKIKEHI